MQIRKHVIFELSDKVHTWRANMKKAHIRSKLLKRCKNVRISTKFVLDILRLLIERSCRCIVHTSKVSLIILTEMFNFD
jgi:hypothetical protein